MALPVHSVQWKVHSSGVADIPAIVKALEWLVGESDCVKQERTQSFHGSDLIILTATANKRGSARRAVPRLGSEVLIQLIDDLQERIDETNILHLRLALDDLVCGAVRVCANGESGELVKGRIKLEVYPNTTAIEVAKQLLEQASELATANNLPECASDWGNRD